MTEQEKRIKRDLQKTLYLNKIEQSEEFIKRFYVFLVKYTREKEKLPNPYQIAKLITSITKDIKEKDLTKIKHKTLKKNKHICFRYFFEEIIELIELDWGAYKIQKYLENKKKCKSPARATIDKFIKDYKEENDNG